MAYVLKAEYEGELRRVILKASEEEDFPSFATAEGRIKQVFELPATTEIRLTYVDKDGDIVTMANDHDLKDACITQEMNPLRLRVALVSSAEVPPVQEAKEVAEVPPADAVETLVSAFEPILRNYFADEHVEEVMNHIVGRVFDNLNAPTWTAERVEAARSRDGTNRFEEKAEVHETVTCDKCQMYPIVGPRYKSMRKDDYDLCGKCYESEHADPTDYKRVSVFLTRFGRHEGLKMMRHGNHHRRHHHGHHHGQHHGHGWRAHRAPFYAGMAVPPYGKGPWDLWGSKVSCHKMRCMKS